MKGETRNQRRSRRRRETHGEREQKRFDRVLQMCMHAPTLVFQYWYSGSMCGYIYNDIRFANGTLIHTSKIVHNKMVMTGDSYAWVAQSLRTTYNVKRSSPSWTKVGAGDARNRLAYKLWPKIVFMALLLRARKRMYAPCTAAYEECKTRFESMSMSM